MTLKRINGLRADIDEAEGEFKIPTSLANADPLARLDILIDWTNGINNEIRKALGDYFIYLATIKAGDDGMKLHFNKRFNAYNIIVKQAFCIQMPNDLEDICILADAAWRKNKNYPAVQADISTISLNIIPRR